MFFRGAGAHYGAHAVRRLYGAGEKLRLSRRLIIMDARLRKAADVIGLMLPDQASPILSPASVRTDQRGIGIDVAIRIRRLRLADLFRIKFYFLIQRLIIGGRDDIADPADHLADQAVIPGRTHMLSGLSLRHPFVVFHDAVLMVVLKFVQHIPDGNMMDLIQLLLPEAFRNAHHAVLGSVHHWL